VRAPRAEPCRRNSDRSLTPPPSTRNKPPGDGRFVREAGGSHPAARRIGSHAADGAAQDSINTRHVRTREQQVGSAGAGRLPDGGGRRPGRMAPRRDMVPRERMQRERKVVRPPSLPLRVSLSSLRSRWGRRTRPIVDSRHRVHAQAETIACLTVPCRLYGTYRAVAGLRAHAICIFRFAFCEIEIVEDGERLCLRLVERSQMTSCTSARGGWYKTTDP